MYRMICIDIVIQSILSLVFVRETLSHYEIGAHFGTSKKRNLFR